MLLETFSASAALCLIYLSQCSTFTKACWFHEQLSFLASQSQTLSGMGTAIYKLSSKIKVQVKKSTTPDCKYTCHSHCQGQVQLNCEPNGKLMECLPAYDTLDHSNNNDKDVEKEKDPLSYLGKEETKEKIQLYNAAVTDKLKMTLNSNGIYTGFIKVQMELRRPITVRTRTNAQSHANGNDTAFYLPKGSINILHISSTNTVREVIEALLKKFLVADNPAKFALYKRCQKEDQVYMCKLSDREHPLYLRLVAGPNLETLSFVLREHETGDVMWEAFTIPELQNFLRILDKEEDEQLQSLKRRYSCYKEKLEEALSGVRKPG
ncbi:ras association domain-containing protein 3 isoform X2 [Eleutherodactylus coqui]|uniref:ras association domain-containing protein 3 isoform X2 n=1 Tax=Eleutherodactylus coqui TaxID=57060 RepID=UPI0034634AF3